MSSLQTGDGFVSPRIINGTDAAVGSFPYIVAMSVDFDFQLHRCAGSLIAPDIVLTTATCITFQNEMIITTNPYTRENPQDGAEVLSVLEYRRHPQYDFQKFRNNIGLLKLSNASARPLVTIDPEMEIMDGQVLQSAGWGTIVPSRNAVFANTLQTSELRAVTNRECLNISATEGDRYDHLRGDSVCAVPLQGIPCTGDVGDPLIVPGTTSDEDRLVGILSRGGGDCTSKFLDDGFVVLVDVGGHVEHRTITLFRPLP